MLFGSRASAAGEYARDLVQPHAVKIAHIVKHGRRREDQAVEPVEQAAVQKIAAELLGNWNTPMAYKPIVASYKKPAAAINRT